MWNEKTLELNVTHEILSICRRFDPHDFSFGTTLIQERNKGYDSKAIAKLPQSWLTSALQYKRAKARYAIGGDNVYVFEINNNSHLDQHTILYHNLAAGRSNVAFYVLPAVFTNGEFYSSLPNLLARTFLVDVSHISPHLVNTARHRLLLTPRLRLAVLHSENQEKIMAISAEEFDKLISEGKVGILISELRKNMKQVPKENLIPFSKRPRFMLSIFPGNIRPDQS